MNSEIIEAVDKERECQDEKWGSPSDHPHTVFEWIGIMENELQEAKKAYFSRPSEHLMLAEIIQVIAVGVACLEQHGIVEFR